MRNGHIGHLTIWHARAQALAYSGSMLVEQLGDRLYGRPATNPILTQPDERQ